MPITRDSSQVSVIFTVLNEAVGAVALVEALLGQTRRPDEIVIVDGGSTDGTLEAVEAVDTDGVPLRCLRAAGMNIAAGRNHAIAHARHGMIACIDAGCIPDQNWLAELVRPFEDPEVAVVGGAYRVESRTRLECVAGLLTMPGQLDSVDPARFNPSARSLAFRVEVWRRAGGFPDWLYTAEDTLFDCKLRRQGEVFAFAPDAIVRWQPRASLHGLFHQFVNYARGEGRIGRGGGAVCFWRRRYMLAAAVLAVVVGVGALVTDTGTFWITGVLCFLVLLLGPVQRRAAAIARRTYDPFDYLLAILLSHVVAVATLVGHRRGTRDRLRSPEIFVDRLLAYWGELEVGEVPPWRMKTVAPPRTLIVSWHWPPTQRASTNVLRNLFQFADPEAFRVLTRAAATDGSDALDVPALAVSRVPAGCLKASEGTIRTWLECMLAAGRMVRAARWMNRDWPIQRVLAVYPHKYSLLAGFVTSRILGVPFVAYMHDLFAETSITKNRLKRTFWNWVDRKALSKAKLVLVASEGFAEHYRRRSVDRVWVLPHCKPLDVEPSKFRKDDGTLRLLYIGSVYQAHEDAVAALVEGADGLPDVTLSFLTGANRIVPSYRRRWVSRGQALAHLRDADVGVVALGRDTPYPEEIAGCFPSKMVDYLAAEKPILAVVPRGCFADRLVRETGCGISVTSGSPHDIAGAIEKLRDSGVRRRMARASRELAEQLDGPRWMRLLEKQLACAEPNPPAPSFPARVEQEAQRAADILKGAPTQ